MLTTLAQADATLPGWLIPFVLFVLTLIGFGITIGMFRQTVKSHTESIIVLEKKSRASRRRYEKLLMQVVVMEGGLRNALRAANESTSVLPSIDTAIGDDELDDDEDDSV